MDYQQIIEFSAAALTPVIAIITIYIALRQHKINNVRLKHELYEKRLQVYNAVIKFLSIVIAVGLGFDKLEYLGEFRRDTSQAYFLFEKDIYEYLDEIYDKAVDLMQLDKSTKEEKEKIGELLKWFGKQISVCREKFGRDLKLKY